MSLLPRAQETLYFESTVGKLFYHPAGFVRLAWLPERTPVEAIKAYYEQVLLLLLNTGAHKILSDHGQRAPLSGLIQQWIVENWLPRAMNQARTRHCAVVEGSDPLHRLSTQSVMSASPAGFIYKRFNTVPEAEAWLLNTVA